MMLRAGGADRTIMESRSNDTTAAGAVESGTMEVSRIMNIVWITRQVVVEADAHRR